MLPLLVTLPVILASSALANAQGNAAAGSAIYTGVCVACHTPDPRDDTRNLRTGAQPYPSGGQNIYNAWGSKLEMRALGLQQAFGISGAHDVAAWFAQVFGGTSTPPPPPPPPAATPIEAVEYYWAQKDHYFVTGLKDEIAALDGGALGGVWKRTGRSFKAWATAAEAPQGASPVCRVYIPAAYGNSHFFSAIPAECQAARDNALLVFESPAVMYVMLPDATGACAAGTQRVYRVWSNRSDSNHRFSTDASLIASMVAAGWLQEGPGPNFGIMCAPQ
jgi:hypothetical protein